MKCGKPTPIHLLDAKPHPKEQHLPWDNLNFDWLECRKCYGPGWVEGVKP